jgi:hypothetical protein
MAVTMTSIQHARHFTAPLLDDSFGQALGILRTTGREGRMPSRRKALVLIAVATAVLSLAGGGSGGASPEPWPSLLGPRNGFPPDVSATVERLWNEPTLRRTVNGRPAHVPFDVYVAFLDTPEVTAAAARFRKLGSYEIQMLDDNRYLASDGDGARGLAWVLRREPRRVVMLSQGEHTGPFLGTISGSALTVLDLDPQPPLVNAKLVAYVYIDNRAAAGLAQMLIPTFGFLADRKLGEGLRVTAEVAEWAVDPSGGFCGWLAREPLPRARRERVLAVLPSCASGPAPRATPSIQSP